MLGLWGGQSRRLTSRALGAASGADTGEGALVVLTPPFTLIMRKLREIQGSFRCGEGRILVELVRLGLLVGVSPSWADKARSRAAREDDKMILAGIRQVGSP